MSTINVPQGFRPLRETLHKLREADEGDFTLVCGEKEWKVHKFLLMAYSDVLYRMATSEKFVECRTGRAELKEVDAGHVECMVEFFYHGDFEDWIAGQEVLEVQLGVSALGEMYNVTSLKTCAAEKVEQRFALWLGNRESLEQALQKIYAAGVPKEVQEAAVKAAAKKLDRLHKMDGLSEVLKKWPDFTAAVLFQAAEIRYQTKECSFHSMDESDSYDSDVDSALSHDL